MGLDCLVPFPFFGGDFHGLHVKLLLSAAAPPAPPHPIIPSVWRHFTCSSVNKH